MSTVFGIVAVVAFVAIVVSADVAASSAEIGLKSTLSLGGGSLVARPFFFGIGVELVSARFLLCSNSKLSSELSDSLSSSDKSQIVLVSAAILSGKGCIVVVGLAMQSTMLLALCSFCGEALQ